MKRTRLADRQLPVYTRGEEILNVVTHAAGVPLGAAALLLCTLFAANSHNIWGIAASAVYGASLIAVFTISAVYHGLKPGPAKKVLQVVDHCTIYFLIAGTYTVILLSALRPAYPLLSFGLLLFEWVLAVPAIVLTAIDLKKYGVFSMICYIGMGWAVIPFWRQVLQVMTRSGFWLLLSGGISYTIGSLLYGLGKRHKWIHSVFHIFVLLGAAAQFLSVLLYAL